MLLRDISPGPGEYELPNHWETLSGQKFGEHNPKSELEWVIHRAKSAPGPDQYSPKLVEPKKGVKFSDFTPKSDVDWMIHRAKNMPGPGEYEPKPVKRSGSLKFSSFNPKSEIETIMARSSDMPGPSDYAAVDLRPVRKRTLEELRKVIGSSMTAVSFAAKMKRRSAKLHAVGRSPRKNCRTFL